jgi:hypothetical protein
MSDILEKQNKGRVRAPIGYARMYTEVVIVSKQTNLRNFV